MSSLKNSKPVNKGSADKLRQHKRADIASAFDDMVQDSAQGKAVRKARGRAEGLAGVTIASNIRFSGVSHYYGETATLKNVTLDVAPGEVMCLLGPSGSGKTTLLRLAAGLAQPSHGQIFINQREVSNPNAIVPPENRGVGLVFQDFALFPHLTIGKNIEFGLTELAARERRDHAKRMLLTVGLDKSLDDYPNSLSGGEQQRVALARALAPKPGILLMDEPFSGLDARLRENVRDETLEILRQTRSTVLIVTHDPEEALKISDNIALLKDGELVQSGQCHELYYQPKNLFAARFFSQLNIFEGEFDGKKIISDMGTFEDLDGKFKKGDLVSICVRPGDIKIKAIKHRKTIPVKNADGLIGYVQARRFIGSDELIDVILPVNNKLVKIRCKSGLIDQGTSQVALELAPENLLFFNKSD